MSKSRAFLVLCTITAAACGGGNSPPQGGETAPGADRAPKTAALETGANLMQAKAPVEKIAMYLNGFHVSKDDPKLQMEAHHYCNQANEDLAQCVLFDGNTAEARLMGVEYIISARLYESLPPEERAFWHPHNYEILSGTLRMPGLPDAAEKQALRGKMNSYGKTWHTWMTGLRDRQPDPLPMGPAHLQWSFNRDGEADPAMIASRDQRFDMNTADERTDRQDLAALAQPQGGVDALRAAFPDAVPLNGVTDNGDSATHPVPILSMKAQQSGNPRHR